MDGDARWKKGEFSEKELTGDQRAKEKSCKGKGSGARG